MDTSVINAMAGCHGNVVALRDLTIAINMNFEASGACACCLWQIR